MAVMKVITRQSGFVYTVTVVENMAGRSGLVWAVMERGGARRTHLNNETEGLVRMVEETEANQLI